MFLLMFENKLGSAPPNEKGTKVGRTLDLGTGSGIWAMEFGDEHPEAEVSSLILSSIYMVFELTGVLNTRFLVSIFLQRGPISTSSSRTSFGSYGRVAD